MAVSKNAYKDPRDAKLRSVEGRNPEDVGAVNEGLSMAAEAAAPGPEPMAERMGAQAQDPTLEDESVPAGPTPKDQFNAPLASEDDEMLFGPTTRPDDSMSTVGYTSRVPMPESIRRQLPALIEAAKDPNAPAELHQFLRLLELHMEKK